NRPDAVNPAHRQRIGLRPCSPWRSHRLQPCRWNDHAAFRLEHFHRDADLPHHVCGCHAWRHTVHRAELDRTYSHHLHPPAHYLASAAIAGLMRLLAASRERQQGDNVMNFGVDTVKPVVVAIDLHRGHLDPAVATMPLTPEKSREVIEANRRFFDRCRAADIPIVHLLTYYRSVDEIRSNPFWRTRAEDPSATRKHVLKHNLW